MGQTRRRDTARRPQRQDTNRPQDRPKQTADESARAAGQAAGARTGTVAVSRDVNAATMRDFAEVSSRTLQESARLFTELHRANLEALGEIQSATMRWLTTWPEMFRDPIRWYRQTLEGGIGVARRTFDLNQRTVATMTRTFERLQSSAEGAAKGVQDTSRHAAWRMQDVQGRAERQRAA
jgi:hypothetical protein